IAAIKKMLLEGGTEKALSNMKLFSKKLEIYQLKTFLLQCGLMAHLSTWFDFKFLNQIVRK
ncbi:MAG: hypothetical protein ABIN67_00550, partial [Ferruginibacter sp.]